MIAKKYVVMLLASAALVLPRMAGAATLAESVSRALSSHPSIAAGRAAAQAADKTVREQKSGFFPTISARAGAGREYADNDTTRGASGGAADAWVKDANVSLTQPVFAGFGIIDRVAAAKDRRDSARYDLGGASEDVALRAARAHLNLMRTKELLDLADTYYAEIQKRHDSIALMVKEGALGTADELQAEEILASAKNTRLGYEEAWHQAEADYIEVVGAPPEGALEFGTPTWEPLIPPSVDEAVRAAVTSNLKVLSADKILSAAGKEADAARGEIYPRLNAEMNYSQKSQSDVMGGMSKDAAAMLRASWNFSTGGAEFARAGRGLDQQAEALARRHEAARNAEHDARQKFTSMQIVDQQFTVLADRAQDVHKILDEFLKQFEAGKQSNLQIMTAHARLFDAEASRADAYYRRLLSRFELLGVAGKLSRALTAATPAAVVPVRADKALMDSRQNGEDKDSWQNPSK